MIGRKLAIMCIIGLISASASLAQVVIQAQVKQRDLRIFFLSDFNFTGKGRATNEVFGVTIINGAVSQSYTLKLSIRKDDVMLAGGRTNPFQMTAGQVISITNVNLFSQAQQFSLDEYQTHPDGEALMKQVMATGKLPTGVYRFTFDIYTDPTETVPESATFIEIDVSNPSSLDLIGPGSPADRAIPAISPTLFPLFRWTSNMERFRLTVAEKLANMHDSASPAEIIQERIRFERILTLDGGKSSGPAGDGAEYIPATSYQYPAVGAWPLQPGKTYYWRITGLPASSGADVELPSEIWAFTVQESSEPEMAGSSGLSDLLMTIRPESGGSIGSSLGRGGELDGYTLTGRYWLNGRWITYEQLQVILIKLASGEYRVLETRVE